MNYKLWRKNKVVREIESLNWLLKNEAHEVLDKIGKFYGRLEIIKRKYDIDWRAVHTDEQNLELEVIARFVNNIDSVYDILLKVLENVEKDEDEVKAIFGGI